MNYNKIETDYFTNIQVPVYIYQFPKDVGY